MNYLLENYKKIENVVDRYSIVCVLVNMVRDANYSALKFMKFVVNNLVEENVSLIRE